MTCPDPAIAGLLIVILLVALSLSLCTVIVLLDRLRTARHQRRAAESTLDFIGGDPYLLAPLDDFDLPRPSRAWWRR